MIRKPPNFENALGLRGFGWWLESAHREVALRERQIPKPPKTESRLVLVKPEHEPPKDDPVVKYTTERPHPGRSGAFAAS